MNTVAGIVGIVVGLAAIIFNRAAEKLNQDQGNTDSKAQSGYNRVVFVVLGLAFVVAGVSSLTGVLPL